MKNRFKFVVMVLLVLVMMFAGAVEAQPPDCSLPTDAGEGIVSIHVFVLWHHVAEATSRPVIFRAYIGVDPGRYGSSVETLDVIDYIILDEDAQVEESEVLREPYRPVSVGLETLWDEDLRPELCAIERSLIQESLGND